ncbi:MAG: DUF1990 domain-containing protein [Lewinella sp.]|nr:DUF1990 domain-containing protein [Lewinella sp.]
MLPRFSLRYPTAAQRQAHLSEVNGLAHNYASIGATRQAVTVPGYRHTSYRRRIGQGPADYAKAREALRQWQPFANGWARLTPEIPGLAPGTDVLASFHRFGSWWHNSCRIIYLVEEENAFGFAYGTLPGHVARGEEYFGVYQNEAEEVCFEIRAFSQADHWLARWFTPVFRWSQRQFVRQAGQAMQRFLETANPTIDALPAYR